MDYITASKVCELLGISRPTLWKYTKSKKIPSYRGTCIGLELRRNLYKLDEILAIRRGTEAERGTKSSTEGNATDAEQS
jgi:excisionase family DNA binding protein